MACLERTRTTLASKVGCRRIPRAKVVGWRENPTKGNSSLHLIAELRRAGQKTTIGIPLAKIPEQQRKECLAIAGKVQSQQAVREICSSMELPYFVHTCRTYVLPDELRKNSSPGDAWLLRDELFSLTGKSKETLRF